MSSQRRKVVIDTDPGIDDAVAILLALRSPELDIAGISTVAGNIGIATTTHNAGRILALAGRADIPVISGAKGPLSRLGFDTADIHGGDGLGGVHFPAPLRAPQQNAVAWLADLLRSEPTGTIDILALGPLTSIAQLVRDHPDAAARLGRVIAMGGAIIEHGNIGPRSEFNIAADPEAADIVLRSGLNVTLIPLDVTRKVRATRAETERLIESSRQDAVACGRLIDAYFLSTAGTSAVTESRPLHDPCVILYALAPKLFEIEHLALSVDLGDGKDAGALTVDAVNGHPVDVAMRVDGAAALAMLVQLLVTQV